MSRKSAIILTAALLLGIGATAFYYAASHDKQQKDSATHQTPEQISERDKAVDQKLRAMPVRDKVALLFIIHTPGTDPQHLTGFINTYKPGGLILMGDNIPAASEDLKSLAWQIKGDSDFPLLVAIDQEGGTVKRIRSDDDAAGIALANAPVSDTTAAFSARSQLLASAGISLNFGIVADVTNDTSSFIYPRVLGTSPEAASERVAAAVHAAKGKTYSTLKHFPGHGETPADSHSTIPATDISLEQWRQHDKPPFAAGINTGAEFVMMGHLKYGSVDNEIASLSKQWYDTLRNELHFKGVAVTDDMFMLRYEKGYEDLGADASKALAAGATMLLYVTENEGNSAGIEPSMLIDYVTADVQSGRLSQRVIDDAARQVLEVQYGSRQLFR